MAVTVTDVLTPKGRIEAHLFPGEGTGDDGGALQLRLQGYITQGATQARRDGAEDVDAATRSWVYFRAFQAVADRLNALPTSHNEVDQGGHDYASDQRRYFAALAAEFKAEYEAQMHAEAIFEHDSPPTRSVETTFTW